MPKDHDPVTIAGVIANKFAHRFVVKTETGFILADLGPKGEEKVALREGDKVEIEGEQKPSEVKVWRIKVGDGAAVTIEHDKKPPKPHERNEPADPAVAVDALKSAGLALVGEPRRKPKHFEALGRRPDGSLVELHVELDGRVRKSRPAEPSDEGRFHRHGA